MNRIAAEFFNPTHLSSYKMEFQQLFMSVVTWSDL